MSQYRNLSTFSFIIGYHLLLVALIPFVWASFTWQAALFFLATFSAGGISITAGYHRLFAHRAYSANPFFEWVVLIGSTLSLQWSALQWAHDHRMHHAHVDTDKDPYSIKKGFWYAHILWLLRHENTMEPKLVGDLLKNPRVAFQSRHYMLLALITNAAVFGIGCLFLSPLLSFFAGVLLRIFAIHHCTWFINSLAHVWGSRTYARELTAVDNALLALVTFGEGYHNYHHTFATDYRNGVRWYHFDPTKWLIWTASKLGITRDLRMVDEVRIQRKLVQKDKNLLLEQLSHQLDGFAHDLKERLEHVATSYEKTSAEFLEKLSEIKRASAEKRRLLELDIKRMRAELQVNWDTWLQLTRLVAGHYVLDHSHH